jgi:diadenosine tetraphosphate (Ap4A) HIT family hydrolase
MSPNRHHASSQRHEERKNQLKALEWDRKQERLDRDSQRQEKRPDDGARAFAGRNLDNHRVAVVSHLHLHLHPAASPGAATEGWGWKYEDEEEEQQQPAQDRALLPNATSGAALLAMARPARVHRGGRNRHDRGDYLGMMTDG